MKSEHRGKDATITYDSEVCIHSGNCVKGLASVFNVERDPWIDPDGASVAALKNAIRNCPSGALTIMVHS